MTWNGHGDAAALWKINPDGTLTLANSFTYSTWGQPTTATHNSIVDLSFRFLYVGRHGVAWDNAFGLGLEHMGARHYSPALGRFLQTDPSALEANLYSYVGGNPATSVDPSGLWQHHARAALEVRDCGLCGSNRLNRVQLDVWWSTVVNAYGVRVLRSWAAESTASWHREGINVGPVSSDTGGWFLTGHSLDKTSGGVNRSWVTVRARASFGYDGVFSWLILPDDWSNVLTVWLTARASGSASCTFDWSIQRDPALLFGFQYPTQCVRFY